MNKPIKLTPMMKFLLSTLADNLLTIEGDTDENSTTNRARIGIEAIRVSRAKKWPICLYDERSNHASGK